MTNQNLLQKHARSFSHAINQLNEIKQDILAVFFSYRGVYEQVIYL